MTNELYKNQPPIHIPEDLPNGRLIKVVAKGLGGAIPGVGSLISELIGEYFPDVNAAEQLIW